MDLAEALRQEIADGIELGLARAVRDIKDHITATVGGQWCSLAEAANTLGIHVETARQFASQGKIKAKKVGATWRVDRTALGEAAGEGVDAAVAAALARGGSR